MKLKLHNLEVTCLIGERPEERVKPQTLHLDVELSVDDRAALSDRLEDTVDYAALAEKLRAALVEARCQMIERAARIVRDLCLAEKGVQAAKVSVTKVGAIPYLESAEVCDE